MSDPTDPATLECMPGQPDPSVSLRIVLTPAVLQHCAPRTHPALIEAVVPAVQRAVDEGGVSSALAAAAMIAEIVEESAGFTLFREVPDPADPHFRRYELGERATEMENTTPGFGELYSGVGLIGLTFHKNFRLFTAWAQARGHDVDFVAHPELVIDPRYLGLEAAWFWSANGLEAPAEVGDIDGCSTLVNAGKTKAHWVQLHGNLVDAADAHAHNVSLQLAPTDPRYQHGIGGLLRRRANFVLSREALAA